MSVLSHLYELFDSSTCVAYIHRLRWIGRPLQCPRCGSYKVIPCRPPGRACPDRAPPHRAPPRAAWLQAAPAG